MFCTSKFKLTKYDEQNSEPSSLPRFYAIKQNKKSSVAEKISMITIINQIKIKLFAIFCTIRKMDAVWYEMSSMKPCSPAVLF